MSTISSNKFRLRDLFKSFKNQQKVESNDIYSNIENAKKQWEEAKNIFENVSQPDLVDFAIYNVEAAEKRYSYLLKQIRNNNVD